MGGVHQPQEGFASSAKDGVVRGTEQAELKNKEELPASSTDTSSKANGLGPGLSSQMNGSGKSEAITGNESVDLRLQMIILNIFVALYILNLVEQML